MKVILQYNMPEEHLEYEAAMKGADALCALEEIRNEVFRPMRKHGYSDEAIVKAIEAKDVELVIELLESKFTQIVNNRDIDV